MKLAVIIPAYNDVVGVLTALNSLQALAADPAVISWHVQDDASPNVFFPAVIPASIASVQRNEQNVGFAANCNAAARFVIEQYHPDVLFFVNQDVYGVPEWSQGWDSGLLDKTFAFDSWQPHPPSIIGARLLFPDGSIQNLGGSFDTLCQPVHYGLGWQNPNAFPLTHSRYCDWTTGAALAVRTELFMTLNGFDEGYERGYFEDVDFCLRATERGHHIALQTACTLIHRVGSTGGSPYFAQNARRFKAQWVDSGKVKPGTLQPTVRYW